MLLLVKIFVRSSTQRTCELVEASKDQSGDEAADDAGPGGDNGAARSNGSESAQQAIAHIQHAPVLVQQPLGEQSGDGRSAPW